MKFKKHSEEDIINCYVGGQNTINSVSKILNIPWAKVKKILVKNDVYIRPYINCNVNHYYFDNISEERKAYFLGLLYADGSVFNGRFSLEMQESEKYLIDELKKDIAPTANLSTRKRKDNWSRTYTFRVSSKTLTDSLIKHGCVEKKSFKIRFPTTLNKELIPHFIRGFFDGDGGFYIKKTTGSPKLEFNSNPFFCEELVKFLYKEYQIKCCYYIRNRGGKRRPMGVIQIFAQSEIKKMYELMYSNENICCIRKKIRMEDFLISKNLLNKNTYE